MSSRPPGDSDDERGSEALEGPLLPLDDSISVEMDLDPPDAWLAQAEAEEPAKDIELFSTEAAAATTSQPGRAAILVHEIAHLRERALGQERDAAKTYAQSLTLDPTFQPNAWALRRIFLRRGFWDNLVRVHDAELRFAPWSRPTDRADLYVERGRIL